MCGDYTGLFQHNAPATQAMRMHLNRNLAATITQVEDKIGWVYEKEIGHPKDWTAFRVHEFTVRIVARMVAGVFVGARFTRDDEWTRLSLILARDLVYARDAIKKWPVWLQPVVGPYLKDIKVVNQQLTKMAEMLKPVIAENVLEGAQHSARQNVLDEKKNDLERGSKDPEGTFMSWAISKLNTTDPEVIARVQLSCKYSLPSFCPSTPRECAKINLVSFASINTTTNALCFIVLDLAQKPEYTAPLRQEIQDVIKEHKIQEDEKGILRWNPTALNKLWKLDSFMKESSRLSKAGST